MRCGVRKSNQPNFAALPMSHRTSFLFGMRHERSSKCEFSSRLNSYLMQFLLSDAARAAK